MNKHIIIFGQKNCLSFSHRLFHFLFFAVCLILAYSCSHDNKLPKEVKEIVELTKSNQQELLKVIDYYNSTGEDQKLKAAYFLIENMYHHYSLGSKWVDDSGIDIGFDEFSFKSFGQAVDSMQKIKASKKVVSQPYYFYDIDSITSEFLIKNIDHAFEVWNNPWARSLDFDEFCEWILPYKNRTEPLQDWHNNFQHEFSWVYEKVSDTCGPVEVCRIINNDLQNRFFNLHNIDVRTEKLPLLGPNSLLFRMQGECPDMVNMGCYALRSLGVPVSSDFTPNWPTSNGRHFWNVVYDKNKNPVQFLGAAKNPGEEILDREVGKVFRNTYSFQKNSLAVNYPLENVPVGFLHNPNLLDVTEEYGPVSNLSFKPRIKPKEDENLIYLTVFNYHDWKLIDWGKFNVFGKAKFKKVGRGAVYLPSYYREGKFIPAHNPILIRVDSKPEEIILDKSKLTDITLKEKAKYLKFRKDRKYAMYYWDDKWVLNAEKIAVGDSITYTGLPSKALYLLIPEYTNLKDRIFTINDKKEIEYW